MSRAFCCNALDTPYTYNSTNKYLITNKAMKKESGPKTNCWALGAATEAQYVHCASGYTYHPTQPNRIQVDGGLMTLNLSLDNWIGRY